MPSPWGGTLGDVWGHLWWSHWRAAPGIEWAGVGKLLNPPQCLGQPPTEDVSSAEGRPWSRDRARFARIPYPAGVKDARVVLPLPPNQLSNKGGSGEPAALETRHSWARTGWPRGQERKSQGTPEGHCHWGWGGGSGFQLGIGPPKVSPQSAS